jgi:hypothetical protein
MMTPNDRHCIADDGNCDHLAGPPNEEANDVLTLLSDVYYRLCQVEAILVEIQQLLAARQEGQLEVGIWNPPDQMTP